MRSVVRQLGLAAVDDSVQGDIWVTPVPVPGRLCWCPGNGFAVDGLVATFVAKSIAALDGYLRRSGRVDSQGRTFSVWADHSGKNNSLHQCAVTLFRLLLSNSREVRFLWWYPEGRRGVLNYRVDVDDNTDATVATLLCQLKPTLSWTSLYFTTAHFTATPAAIGVGAGAGAEIGSHGHYHYTFERNALTNERNVSRSIEFLRGLGYEISGMVLPSGKSFRGIGRIIEKNTLSYTSNFGCLFDSLPFEMDDGGRRHLEVPIHPVAPGNVIKSSAGLDGLDDYMLAYYLNAARELSASGLPLFFYGHNNDVAKLKFLPRLLDELTLRYPDHLRLRLDQFAAFWRRRLQRLDRWSEDGGDDNVAVISPERPDWVTVRGGYGERTWPLPLDHILRSPLCFNGPGVHKPRLRDRIADRFELEVVLPIGALSFRSVHSWVSAGYKLIRRVVRALVR